jgi:CRP-like cAMP-binding protein
MAPNKLLKGDPGMSETVTLELPEPLAQSARAVAARTSRPVEDVLMEWLDRAAADLPVELLPDEQVLAIRDLQMGDKEQEELSALLAGRREHQLDSSQRMHLDNLLMTYRLGMVRKAQALKVAVERGLQPPLT